MLLVVIQKLTKTLVCGLHLKNTCLTNTMFHMLHLFALSLFLNYYPVNTNAKILLAAGFTVTTLEVDSGLLVQCYSISKSVK
jgi:hypothetical protein